MSHEDLIKELSPVGKYRVRILRAKSGPVVDIREFISDETFEGFTRRGIRLGSRIELLMLRDILNGIDSTEWDAVVERIQKEKNNGK